MTALHDLQTPALVLDCDKMDANVARLRGRLTPLGAGLRVHLKTVKSAEVARRILGPGDTACVSTLREAEEFAAAGIRDMIYAVGIAPDKLPRVVALLRRGVDLAVLLDSPAQARAVAQASRAAGIAIPAYIELDCDGHRAGLQPGDTDSLSEIAAILAGDGATLRGVLVHAGESYYAADTAGIAAFAETERKVAVDAALALRARGHACPSVSVGSTPTAHFASDLSGVTEVRAGVFVFFDLVMAGIGVCGTDDIALSVLTSVIGHQKARGWMLCDAGWMALSRDRGTQRQPVDQGYGLVCDIDGRPYPDLIVESANQEHGVIKLRPGSGASLPDLPIGTRLRILPNHACATAAQHDSYHVVHTGSPKVAAVWPRFGGW